MRNDGVGGPLPGGFPTKREVGAGAGEYHDVDGIVSLLELGQRRRQRVDCGHVQFVLRVGPVDRHRRDGA
jgi:hypothetical protein